jgi:hypothetical protein
VFIPSACVHTLPPNHHHRSVSACPCALHESDYARRCPSHRSPCMASLRSHVAVALIPPQVVGDYTRSLEHKLGQRCACIHFVGDYARSLGSCMRCLHRQNSQVFWAPQVLYLLTWRLVSQMPELLTFLTQPHLFHCKGPPQPFHGQAYPHHQTDYTHCATMHLAICFT